MRGLDDISTVLPGMEHGTNMIVTVIIPMALWFRMLLNLNSQISFFPIPCHDVDVMTHPHDVQLIRPEMTWAFCLPIFKMVYHHEM